jgi:hypothetical protein
VEGGEQLKDRVRSEGLDTVLESVCSHSVANKGKQHACTFQLTVEVHAASRVVYDAALLCTTLASKIMGKIHVNILETYIS